MALVLTGLNSYSLMVPTGDGRTKRVNLRRGQSVDNLGLSEGNLDTLREIKTLTANRTPVNVFSDIPTAFDAHRHRSGGVTVGPAEMKRQAENAAKEAAREAEAAAETVAEPVVEAKVEAAPKKAAPKKSAKKSTKK